MNKIPCVVLIYDNLEIIKRSISSLQRYYDYLDIHIIENPSKYTPNYSKPAMLSLLHDGIIKSYSLFEDNITNNAIESFLTVDPCKVWDSDKIMITDGDVVADGDWLEKQIYILDKYKDVFCCSVEMSLEGWSEGLKQRFGKEKNKTEDYLERSSGIWLCLFRTDELKKAFEIFQDNRFRFRDGPLMRFVTEYWRKKWVVARGPIARELTRSGYSNPSYYEEKNEKIQYHGTIVDFWNHNDFSDFTVYTKENILNIPAVNLPSTRPEAETLNQDWLINDSQVYYGRDLFFGINMKNRFFGKVTMGNSSTRSLFDKFTDTVHIKCRIDEELPNIQNVFKRIVYYNHIYNFPENIVLRHLQFFNKALIPGGSLRIISPNLNSIFKAYTDKNIAFFEKLLTRLYLSTETSIDDKLEIAIKDLLGEKWKELKQLEGNYIEYILKKAGFGNFNYSQYDPNIDLPPKSRYDYFTILESSLVSRDNIDEKKTQMTSESKKWSFKTPYKLNIGCGSIKLNGWVNIDSHLKFGITDLQHDVSKGLPFEENSCGFIYHEHLLEHLTVEEGLKFLKECYRVLKKDGVMRIAMPSLDVLIEKCYLGTWKDQEWLKIPRYHFIKTRAEMLNVAFRYWGHQYIYDSEELHRRLHESGFPLVKDLPWCSSDFPELQNLETRKDSLLICEAYK